MGGKYQHPEELVKKFNIDVQELYETFMSNGGLYTAKKFNLWSAAPVLRILDYYNYDYSKRDIKKINYTKTEKTLEKKYGVKHALQIPEAKNKLVTTNLEKFGSEYYMGTQDFKEKSIATNIQKYGTTWSTQNEYVKKKHEQANFEKYGVKDCKQLKASSELKQYLNNKELSQKFFLEHNFTFFDLKQFFSEDAESQLWSWINRFDLIKYLKHESRSLPEKELAQFAEKLGFTSKNNRKILGNGQEIDLYNPKLKIGIEFNGLYYHCDSQIKDKKYHYKKSLLAEQKGIRLIHIYENEWFDEKLREKIKNLLLIASGKIPKENKIYARKCIVKEITNKEAKAFNEANHLQGHRNAQITYGLFYKDKLVQLMSFSKTKYNRNLKTDNSWEIIRGCPGSNNIVVGGVSKLFKHFIREYDPDQIFSYCDFNKFDGKGYDTIGMKFIGYTGPNKWWWIKGYTLVQRNPKKYAEYKNKAISALYGAGSKKYLWTKDINV